LDDWYCTLLKVVYTLFPGDVPSESVAINVVTVVPIGTSSFNVTGRGTAVYTGGMSLRSWNQNSNSHWTEGSTIFSSNGK